MFSPFLILDLGFSTMSSSSDPHLCVLHSAASSPVTPPLPGCRSQLHMHLLLHHLAHWADQEVCSDRIREGPLPIPHRLHRTSDLPHHLLYPFGNICLRRAFHSCWIEIHGLVFLPLLSWSAAVRYLWATLSSGLLLCLWSGTSHVSTWQRWKEMVFLSLYFCPLTQGSCALTMWVFYRVEFVCQGPLSCCYSLLKPRCHGRFTAIWHSL